jgi:hypothetical protein
MMIISQSRLLLTGVLYNMSSGCRHSSNLVDLSLELRPASITASMQTMHLADDTAAAAAAATGAAAALAERPSVAGSQQMWWPQQLTSLRLCVPGE